MVFNMKVTIRGCIDSQCSEMQLDFSVISRLKTFSYGTTAIKLITDVEVTITPTVDGDVTTFAISSGSLPIGLSLDPLTGVISGTPIKDEEETEVEITAFNSFNSMVVKLQFVVQEASSLIFGYLIIAGIALIIIINVIALLCCCLCSKRKKMPVQKQRLV